MPQDKKVLLQVDNLKKYFPVRAGVFKKVVAHVQAVDDISFKVYEGETIGLVGESGCGKSTTGMTILRLLNPTAGRIVVDGLDTTPLFLPKSRVHKYINETYIHKFNELIAEGLFTHGLVNSGAEATEKVKDLLDKVGLSSEYIYRFPHEYCC